MHGEVHLAPRGPLGAGYVAQVLREHLAARVLRPVPREPAAAQVVRHEHTELLDIVVVGQYPERTPSGVVW